jgi:hypothetical protein
MNIDSSQKVIYNYYDTTIYLNQFEKIPEKGGYIKLPFTNSKSILQPNLIHSPSQNKYYVENLYIFRKSNSSSINDIDYDGELVIEHSPITNGLNKVYTRIPLKTQTNIDEMNDLDKIINESLNQTPVLSTIILNLNHLLIHHRTCLVNKSHSVFIIREPILIRSSLSVFSNAAIDDYFPNYRSDDFTLIQILSIETSVPEDTVEGFSDREKKRKKDKDQRNNEQTNKMKIGNDLYIECKPTGASKETIEMYNLPVNGAISSNLGKIGTMNTTQNFFVFAIMIGLAVIVSPFLYKNFIIPFITTSGIDAKVQGVNLNGLDVILSILIAGFTIGLSILGMNTHNSTQTSIGIILFIYFTISFGVIYGLKNLNPRVYSLNSIYENKYQFEILSILYNFIQNNLNQVIKVAFFILSLYFFIYFMSSYRTFFSKGDKGNKTRSGFWYGFSILAVASIFISYSLYKVNA